MGEELKDLISEEYELRHPDVAQPPTPLTPRARRKVLFASRAAQWPISAMLKADAFAKYLGAELLVLQVSKPGAGSAGIFRREAQEARWAIERWSRDSAEALKRCNYILPGQIPSENLRVKQGDFLTEIVQLVAETGAELVVLAPEGSENGFLAAEIAHAAKVPVLVARPPRSHNIVLAATTLADGRYPVIHTAGQIQGLTGAQLLLVHNVKAQQAPSGAQSNTAHPGVLSARLHYVANAYPGCSAAFVKSQSNTSQAILEAARECDADLIVLGVTRSPSRIDRLFGGCVGARVAEQALRSVLLTPIAGLDAAA